MLSVHRSAQVPQLKRRLLGTELARTVLLAGCAAVLVPAQAGAQSTVVPSAGVRIDRCAVESRSVLPDPFNGFRQEVVTGVTLTFVNLRPAMATVANVSIRYQGSTQTVTEHGSFASGVPIDRTLAAFAGEYSGSNVAVCSIVSATFADGTTLSVTPDGIWHTTPAPSAPPR